MGDKSFTDTIYQDLVDGLKTGDFNQTHFRQMLITETQAGSWEGMYSRIGRWGGPVDASQVKRAEFSHDSVI